MTSIMQQEIREKRLVGSKCGRCGKVSFPAMTVCPKCGPKHSMEVKPLELPSIGTVITWTKLQVAPKGFPSPLAHCIVELGSVRILGTVQGTPEIQNGERLMIVEDPAGRLPFVFLRPFTETKPT